MKKFLNSAVVALALALAAGAQATTYNFSYVFGEGNPDTMVTGAFEGQSNGDLITNLSNVSLTINGYVIGPNPEIVGYSFSPPVASFSGTHNDFIFGVPSAGTISGFGMTYAFDVGGLHAPPPYPQSVAYDVLGRFSAVDVGFVNDWKVTAVAAVPEPATYAMLLAGLGLLSFIARRRKQA